MNCQGRNGGAQGDLCIGALAWGMRPPGVSCSRSTSFTVTGAERLRVYKVEAAQRQSRPSTGQLCCRTATSP